MNALVFVNISDVFGCQKSGSGRVRVSLTRVRVGFGCQMSGFVRVRVIFVGFFGCGEISQILTPPTFFNAFLCMNIFQTSKNL